MSAYSLACSVLLPACFVACVLPGVWSLFAVIMKRVCNNSHGQPATRVVCRRIATLALSSLHGQAKRSEREGVVIPAANIHGPIMRSQGCCKLVTRFLPLRLFGCQLVLRVTLSEVHGTTNQGHAPVHAGPPLRRPAHAATTACCT